MRCVENGVGEMSRGTRDLRQVVSSVRGQDTPSSSGRGGRWGGTPLGSGTTGPSSDARSRILRGPSLGRVSFHHHQQQQQQLQQQQQPHLEKHGLGADPEDSQTQEQEEEEERARVWEQLQQEEKSLRGVPETGGKRSTGLRREDHTPYSMKDYKLRVLEESDPGLISTLQHRLSDQRVELETRTHAISAIQRNFENLSKVYQQNKEKIRDLEQTVDFLQERIAALEKQHLEDREELKASLEQSAMLVREKCGMFRQSELGSLESISRDEEKVPLFCLS